MNRRDAIKALAGALPLVTSVSVAQLTPRDVIVIETDDIISVPTADRIRCYCENIWPGQRVAVLSQGMKMKVVRGNG